MNCVKKQKKMLGVETLVFIDLETSGLPDQEWGPTKITELCLVAVRTTDLLKTPKGELPRVVNKLNMCFHPKKPIDPVATLVSGLSNDMLSMYGTFDEKIGAMISNFLVRLPKPVCFVAHNGSKFDYKVFADELKRAKALIPDGLLCVDSITCFRSLYALGRARRKLFEDSDDDGSSRRESTPLSPTIMKQLAATAAAFGHSMNNKTDDVSLGDFLPVMLLPTQVATPNDPLSQASPSPNKTSGTTDVPSTDKTKAIDNVPSTDKTQATNNVPSAVNTEASDDVPSPGETLAMDNIHLPDKIETTENVPSTDLTPTEEDVCADIKVCHDQAPEEVNGNVSGEGVVKSAAPGQGCILKTPEGVLIPDPDMPPTPQRADPFAMFQANPSGERGPPPRFLTFDDEDVQIVHEGNPHRPTVIRCMPLHIREMISSRGKKENPVKELDLQDPPESYKLVDVYTHLMKSPAPRELHSAEADVLALLHCVSCGARQVIEWINENAEAFPLKEK